MGVLYRLSYRNGEDLALFPSAQDKDLLEPPLSRRANGVFVRCVPDWIRTNDTRFRRAVLYPLSYRDGEDGALVELVLRERDSIPPSQSRSPALSLSYPHILRIGPESPSRATCRD